MNDQPKVLQDIFAVGDVVMLTLSSGAELSSRPMTIAAVDDDRLGMLMSTSADWYSAVRGGDGTAHVTSCDHTHNQYAAVNGDVTISQDRSEIERLWSVAASAFFDGADDPDIAALHVEVTDGQYWDAPSGKLGSLLAMVKAAIGGAEAAGDHGRIATP